MYWGPHHRSIGKRLASSRLTIMRRLTDQVSGVPSGVPDQSSARMCSPISPPPARKSRPEVSCAVTAFMGPAFPPAVAISRWRTLARGTGPPGANDPRRQLRGLPQHARLAVGVGLLLL